MSDNLQIGQQVSWGGGCGESRRYGTVKAYSTNQYGEPSVIIEPDERDEEFEGAFGLREIPVVVVRA